MLFLIYLTEKELFIIRYLIVQTTFRLVVVPIYHLHPLNNLQDRKYYFDKDKNSESHKYKFKFLKK